MAHEKMSLLSKEELELFRKLCNESCWYHPSVKEWNLVLGLADEHLVFIGENGWVAVPVDLKEHFEKIDTGEFKTKHEALRWFCKCIFAANCLYASVPVSVFQKLYERKKGMKIDTDKIHHFMNQMPEENEAMILVGDRLIAAKLYDSGQYKLVEHDQGDKEFYIPEPGEVELLYNYKYPAYEKEYQKYAAFIAKEFGADDDTLFTVVYFTYRLLSLGGMISGVSELLEEEGLVFSSEKAVQEFASLIVELSDNTRMVSNCGFKPSEIAARSRKSNMRIVKKNSQKIYLNSPCPCGSGKKYKKCCGRNKQEIL